MSVLSTLLTKRTNRTLVWLCCGVVLLILLAGAGICVCVYDRFTLQKAFTKREAERHANDLFHKERALGPLTIGPWIENKEFRDGLSQLAQMRTRYPGFANELGSVSAWNQAKKDGFDFGYFAICSAHADGWICNVHAPASLVRESASRQTLPQAERVDWENGFHLGWVFGFYSRVIPQVPELAEDRLPPADRPPPQKVTDAEGAM